MRVTDSVYLLSGAPYGQVGNAYAIVKDKKIILIDCGKNQAALDIMLENLEYFGLSEYPITHLLITHMHNDHMGNAWYFREKGAEVICSEPDASGVEDGGVRANDFGFQPFKTCKVDRRFGDYDSFTINGIKFETVLVPGHTNGSAFFIFEIDKKRMVATGDTVLPQLGVFDDGIEPSLGWTGSYEYDKDAYIASLEKTLTVEADIMLGGHGVPVMKDGALVIRKAFRKALMELR